MTFLRFDIVVVLGLDLEWEYRMCPCCPTQIAINLSYEKCRNEERARRLKVVKLLTALSYCVSCSSIYLSASISLIIAVTVKRCASAKKP